MTDAEAPFWWRKVPKDRESVPSKQNESAA
jgi:hypothetical protein